MADDFEQAQTFVLHTDGGSRGNPGPSGIGFVLERGSIEVACGGAFIGTTTNNVAEYEALIWGLENARELGARRVEMIADSELMVKQVTGVYKVKNDALKALSAHAQALLAELESWSFEHTLREGNSEADALVNQALDARDEVGEAPVAYTQTPRSLFSPDALDSSSGDGVSAKPDHDSAARSAAPSPAKSGCAGMTETNKREDTMSSKHTGTAQTDQTPGTYYLTVKEHFDAAHSLYDYPGPCRELHGHTWDIEVTVQGRELDKIGIIYDFKSLKDDLRAVLADYDHHNLNNVAPFETLSPTAENLARVIYDRLAQAIDPRVKISEVAVWESPAARLVFRADDAR